MFGVWSVGSFPRFDLFWISMLLLRMIGRLRLVSDLAVDHGETLSAERSSSESSWFFIDTFIVFYNDNYNWCMHIFIQL